MFLNRAVTVVYKPNEWVLVRPLVWAEDRGFYEYRLIVEARFISDLASVGFLAAFSWFSPNGASRQPALLHDYLYCMGLMTRKQADQKFYAALLAEGMKKPVAYMHYLGVRAGGWRYWGKRRKNPELGREDFVPEDEFKKLVDYYA